MRLPVERLVDDLLRRTHRNIGEFAAQFGNRAVALQLDFRLRTFECRFAVPGGLLASFRGGVAAEGREAELSNREREVLMGFARGESPKAIADRLGISAKTVNNQISLVKQKLGIADAPGLVRYAMRRGYIDGV